MDFVTRAEFDAEKQHFWRGLDSLTKSIAELTKVGQDQNVRLEKMITKIEADEDIKEEHALRLEKHDQRLQSLEIARSQQSGAASALDYAWKAVISLAGLAVAGKTMWEWLTK